MARTAKATKTQWADIEQLKRWWLDTWPTQQIDVDEARRTVYEVLDDIGIVGRPLVFVARSPTEARMIDFLLANERRDMRLFCGLFWAPWYAWYKGGELLGAELDKDKLTKLGRFVCNCPVWMWSDTCIYVLQKPVEIHWDEDGLLHREDGPSVVFSDQFGMWTIHGVAVDEQIVMRPSTQTVTQIDAEKNSDVRSIRIERFGWPQYIKELGARPIDERQNDIEGTVEQLYDVGGQRRLIANCPSDSSRIVSLAIPGDIETCADAQRWLGDDDDVNILGRT